MNEWPGSDSDLVAYIFKRTKREAGDDEDE
jgi:hypothetical protein